jgi:hypothetical protein
MVGYKYRRALESPYLVQAGDMEPGATGLQFRHDFQGAFRPGLVIVQTLHSQSPAAKHHSEELGVRAPTGLEHKVFTQAGRDIGRGIVVVPGYTFDHFELPRKQ